MIDLALVIQTILSEVKLLIVLAWTLEQDVIVFKE